MKHYLLHVGRDWDGRALAEPAEVRVQIDGEALRVELDACFYGDPPPPGPVGWTDGLWEHEVVELFLVAADGRYCELEFGPHGHYLGLSFSAPRVRAGRVEGRYACTRSPDLGAWSDTWVGGLPFPEPVVRANAFAIHGPSEARRHEVAASLPGQTPNYHQPSLFPSLSHWILPPSASADLLPPSD